MSSQRSIQTKNVELIFSNFLQFISDQNYDEAAVVPLDEAVVTRK